MSTVSSPSGGVGIFEDNETPVPAEESPDHVSYSCPVLVDGLGFGDTRLPADNIMAQQHKFTLDIKWNPMHRQGFIRLCVSGIVLPGTTNTNESVYLCIPPERVAILSVLHTSGQQGIFCKNTHTFTFHLSKPPYLVLPPDYTDLRAAVPYSTTADVLDSLFRLVKGSHFQFHAKIDPKKLSIDQIDNMAIDFSSSDFEHLSNAADTRSFYGGRGGCVVEDCDVPVVSSEVVPNLENLINMFNIQGLLHQAQAGAPLPCKYTCDLISNSFSLIVRLHYCSGVSKASAFRGTVSR